MAKRTCDCDECAKCKRRVYMNEWYRRPGKAERVRTWARRYRDNNLERVREYDRERGVRDADRIKVRTRAAVNAAVQRGDLVPQPCEVCGTEGKRDDGRRLVQGHHDDYSKPLAVRWLCPTHHGELHQQVAA